MTLCITQRSVLNITEVCPHSLLHVTQESCKDQSTCLLQFSLCSSVGFLRGSSSNTQKVSSRESIKQVFRKRNHYTLRPHGEGGRVQLPENDKQCGCGRDDHLKAVVIAKTHNHSPDQHLQRAGAR